MVKPGIEQAHNPTEITEIIKNRPMSLHVLGVLKAITVYSSGTSLTDSHKK